MIKITLNNGKEIITDKVKWISETVLTASMETHEDYIKDILEDGGNVIEIVGDVLYEEWPEREEHTLGFPPKYRELARIEVNGEVIDIDEMKKIEVI